MRVGVGRGRYPFPILTIYYLTNPTYASHEQQIILHYLGNQSKSLMETSSALQGQLMYIENGCHN